jgi:hypothetical protein
MARLLPSLLAMFRLPRAAAYVLVLGLALGSSAAELCRSWCHPASADAACDHVAPLGGSVTAGDTCDDIGRFTAVLLKEDVRTLLSPDQGGAAVLPGQRAAAVVSASTLRPPATASPPRANRPLFTILRI